MGRRMQLSQYGNSRNIKMKEGIFAVHGLLILYNNNIICPLHSARKPCLSQKGQLPLRGASGRRKD
ncbi:hypothetical protein RvY_05146 [Ramazzottius varieornatus]|uniref:Uncharacterized protein n=1 Tax=Ramazzottius varieornatus TaxID=947166 RepID=A0A1D1UU12_RAMVA|nr:hypothetical protein RvY_05146 [Ramazzottius varieornatus]